MIAATCLSFALTQAGWLRMVENEHRSALTQLVSRPASGQVHIVEIDAQSLAQVEQYPFSRSYYARLVEQLDKAGARSVVFDINFSSRSSADGDAAFAKAIAQAKASIVIPTFRQRVSETLSDQLDQLPIPELREHSSLASVSVLPDSDSRVRRMVYGTITNGVPRPSLSAQIAGVSGAVNQSFPIDYSIDSASIPRHSFMDVANGRFDATGVAGKDIMIGATAIDLGDRYGTPIHGVISGVTIQALAAETLLRGALTEYGAIPVLLLGLILGLFVTRIRSYEQLAAAMAASLFAFVALEGVLLHALRISVEAVPAMLVVILTAMGQGLRIARAQLRAKALVDSVTGFPNALAYAQARAHDADFVAAALIKEFDAIQTVVGQDMISKLFHNLADELEASAGVTKVFRSDTRMIAWEHKGAYQDLINVFESLSETLLKPMNIAGRRVDVGLAFGLARTPALDAASRAAALAATQGELWHAHEDAEAAIIEQRVSLMGELDEAIKADQLKVVYQPKLRLKTDRIESVEALVRWAHPSRGFMRPDHFVPLAEETNRIEAMTLFVLQRTIDDLRGWLEAGMTLSAAVNISAKLISSEKFVSAAEAIIKKSGVPSERLIFEVTESATMSDQKAAVRNLERFRALGLHISMDDYGTGQSSLSYLQSLPLTELKIDRAFVQNAHIERSDALLVKSTIELAHSLGLRVVCEGVEVDECLAFLREVDCDYAQGYLISKPLSTDELKALLRSETDLADTRLKRSGRRVSPVA